ncbi:DUF4376 domain-containing protein [Aeromonas hydrophila]|uniref:DUF4376 domain-containing protein n=1 Tax=Aeromonas hydrophila TaxID=644 RepID=UPI003D21F0B8
MYYSKSKNGFYCAVIHSDVPQDAVEITKDEYSALLDAQASGKRITADDNGHPIAIDQPPLVSTQSLLLAEVATKRWQVETGGIYINGRHISTDRESQAQLTSTYNSLLGALISDTYWKAADGSFTLVTLSEIEIMLRAVSEHVRACFSAEQRHVAAIISLQTQADLDSYDIHTGWPEQPQWPTEPDKVI